jgi:NTP pyrophosphatase (non-canonical NTP hydrolase)
MMKELLDYRVFQQEVDEWSRQNFGSSPAWQPLMGLLEEVGELAHAYLKRAQGIRGTKEEHDAAERDALGDIMVFLAHYCCRRGIAMGGLAQVVIPDLLYRKRVGAALLGLARHVGDIHMCLAVDPDTRIYASVEERQAIANLLRDLCVYCTLRELDLGEIVRETWDKVKQRNWKKDPQSGGEKE